MRRVLGILLSTAAVVALSGGDTVRSRPDLSPESETYLLEALALLQDNAVDRATVDWRAVRGRAFRAAAGARGLSELHDAIGVAIIAIGNRHTFLLEPGLGDTAAGTPVDVPVARLIDGRIAVLIVPELRADEQNERRYVDAGVTAVRAVDAARPCGWIVDLRTNSGGNMWPMLAVLAPLLADGLLGSFVGPGLRLDWDLHDGKIRMDGTVLGENELRLARPEPPVALLTSGDTASAAEATLIAFRGLDRARSFGGPTAGLATANGTFELDDGAVLVITTAYNADRTGRRYGNEPIPPDQPADDAETAAATWLSAQPGCLKPSR